MKTDFSHGGQIPRQTGGGMNPAEEFLDFSASLNPLGFPEWLRPVISSAISDLSRYPDPKCKRLIDAIADRYGVDPGAIVAGNGATQIIFAVPEIAELRKGVTCEPAYVDYRAAMINSRLDVKMFYMPEASRFRLDPVELGLGLDGDELVIIGNPNNPVGNVIKSESLRELALRHKRALFVVDESFAGFVKGFDSLINNRPPNVVVVMSFTKLFAIPGLRLGAAFADKDIAAKLRSAIPPWSVNTLAQVVGVHAAQETEYVDRTIIAVTKLRGELKEGLDSIGGVKVFDSDANFLLARVERPGANARQIANELSKDGITIRLCENFEGLDNRYFRVAVRVKKENDRLVEAVARALGRRANGFAIKSSVRKTPSIMFQGVSSSSGKSVLTAAFCRILKQDGFKVAPFKAQNMALNSYVTPDGGEMGRAQVTQALACGLECDTRMNPILLKPNSDTGSQVIVLGSPIGSMNVAEYFEYKKVDGFEVVKKAYDSLAAEYDVIVMEGAGSPAEVNLKQGDIVNMRMARHAGARALIVGDIDRGGVFASFIGCLETMTEWERKIAAGFVINKFRGDSALLDSAFSYTLRHTGLATFGVVPYIHDLGLPEEDQAGARGLSSVAKEKSAVRVAVVKLRHISNFTDIDPLMMEPDIDIVEATRPEDLNGADAVIIPGSKNVIYDLAILMENGIGARLKRMAASGGAEIIGICGGFQAIGLSVSDYYGIESSAGGVEGLGLLPVRTTIMPDKTLRRIEGEFCESGHVLSGYEIHHGKTVFDSARPSVKRGDGEVVGVRSDNGLVWGTYMHGIFAKDEFRRWFIDRLRLRKGLEAKGKIVARYDLDAELDKLAEEVRRSVKIENIYSLMGLK
ncbi:Cobyric acid synthase [hydrothermal vent metagenome]|uniref:threonine-phosphate decarboxylase n=1 Tax=hydrothermal vent metagenome TaxID=652676 RepID=A0A3B1CH20_9ZZZZ